MDMKKYIALAALTLVAVGCNNVDNVEPTDPNVIRVEASLNGTRVTLTDFEQNDVMGLFAVEYVGDVKQPLQVIGNYINNEPLTYDGAQWIAQSTLYWSQNACDFYGVYPYMELETIKDFLFDVQTDQNSAKTAETLGGYEASDLMWAVDSNVKQSDGNVSLNFKHMMSRLVINLVKGDEYEGELPQEISAHIYNTATTALVDLSAGNLEKYALSGKNTITMRQVDEDTFDAIVVPQHIERDTPLVEITMDGIAYLLEYSISFRPGYQHTINVVLNTSPDQEKIEISIDGEVGGWE